MSKELSNPSIIYNVAGAPLRSFFQSDMRRLGQMVTSSGFEGISALPFRVENLVEMYRLHFPPIMLVEDAWNPGEYNDIGRAILMGINGDLKRRRGDTTEPPILWDTLFFPNKDTSEALVNDLMEENQQTHFGSVSFESRFPSERTHVHVQREHKPHNLSADEILYLAEDYGNLLLFDPTHLLHPSKVSFPNTPTREYKGEWERQLIKFSSRVAGIDIHAADECEIDELLEGNGKLYELAQAGIEVCENLNFLRVEAIVPLTSQVPLSPYQKSGTEYLSSIVEVLKSIT